MFSKTAIVLAIVGAASAAPSVKPRATIAAGDKFGLTAVHSGSGVHLQSLQAAKTGLYAGLASQGATCDSEQNFATFTLNDDGSLSLYSTDAPYQDLYVDASGMGQGAMGYTTGAQSAPSDAQTTSFTLDDADDLAFNGAAFIACPAADGSYSIWADAGVANPGGNSDCVGINLRATKTDAPVSCTYSQSS